MSLFTIPRTVNKDLADERKKATFDVDEFSAWWSGGQDKLLEKRKIVNKDLADERKKATFDVEEFSAWWCGGRDKLLEKRKIEKCFFDDASLRDLIPTGYLSHKELYQESLRKNALVHRKLHQFIKENWGPNIDNVTKIQKQVEISGFLGGSEVFRDGHPFGVHYGMFCIGLLSLASKEQLDYWLEKVYNFQIIGTYAQTELGHGTFVRGVQTTATYDPKTEEFIMQTPCLEAYKWWPGGLGHNSNYALVVAQLYNNGQCHGVHQFMVPIRNSETWDPMPGITVGEAGPKLGTRNYNNGFLKLDNVRIPRMNMMMKFSQLLNDGTYMQSKSIVLAYTTMSHIRAYILYDTTHQLSKATTIAVRYSAVRRQSPIEPNKPEPQIIDHITQQYKLIPNIAKCVVFKMLANQLRELFDQVMIEVDNGDLRRLQEVHALLSCFKPLATASTSEGVEQQRLACGGHGYMDSANFTKIYAFATAACTYEGENTVLLLQAARFLIKSWSRKLSGEPLEPTVAYLENMTDLKSFKWNRSTNSLIKALQIAAAEKTRIAYEHVKKRQMAGHSQEMAANLTGMELVQAAEAHGVAALVEIAHSVIAKLPKSMSNDLRTILEQLVELFTLDIFLKRLNDLLRFVNITEANIRDMQIRLEELLALLRPNAVSLVDGFDHHDMNLCSTLGSYDGNVYERLYDDAQKSPLNEPGAIRKTFEDYIRPLQKSML